MSIIFKNFIFKNMLASLYKNVKMNIKLNPKEALYNYGLI